MVPSFRWGWSHSRTSSTKPRGTSLINLLHITNPSNGTFTRTCKPWSREYMISLPVQPEAVQEHRSLYTKTQSNLGAAKRCREERKSNKLKNLTSPPEERRTPSRREQRNRPRRKRPGGGGGGGGGDVKGPRPDVDNPPSRRTPPRSQPSTRLPIY